MKFRVTVYDGEDEKKVMEELDYWDDIEAIDEEQAAEEYAKKVMECPENGEEIEVWVQSDRLYKFKVEHVISSDFYADEIEEL